MWRSVGWAAEAAKESCEAHSANVTHFGGVLFLGLYTVRIRVCRGYIGFFYSKNGLLCRLRGVGFGGYMTINALDPLGNSLGARRNDSQHANNCRVPRAPNEGTEKNL